jgi:hypothetical protein
MKILSVPMLVYGADRPLFVLHEVHAPDAAAAGPVLASRYVIRHQER